MVQKMRSMMFVLMVLVLVYLPGCTTQGGSSVVQVTEPQDSHEALAPVVRLLVKRYLHEQPSSCHYDTVEDLMVDKMATGLTAVSFLLFHSDKPEFERAKALEEVQTTMLSCIPNLRSLVNDFPMEERVGFDYHLERLTAAMLGMQLAAQERDFRGAEHWFWHTKQACLSCHNRFLE